MVVAATNRPNRLNDAIWRRFTTQLEVCSQPCTPDENEAHVRFAKHGIRAHARTMQVPLPDEEARFDILCVKAAALQRQIAVVGVAMGGEAEAALPQARMPGSWLKGTTRTALGAEKRAELCAACGVDAVRCPTCVIAHHGFCAARCYRSFSDK